MKEKYYKYYCKHIARKRLCRKTFCDAEAGPDAWDAAWLTLGTPVPHVQCVILPNVVVLGQTI